MFRVLRAVVVVHLFGLFGTLAWAHGGGLDANGCHTNRKTGEYHCHRAQGATAPQRSTAPVAAAGMLPAVGTTTPPGTARCSDRELTLSTQILLKVLGHDSIDTDGRLGASTQEAIRRFQRENYMEPDGQPSGGMLVRLSDLVARRASGSASAEKKP